MKRTSRYESTKSYKHTLWEYAKMIVISLIIALLIRSFIFEPFEIPSGSMKPTLQVGDYLFVTKFSYGYGKYFAHFPLPFINKPLFFHAPERGDVVIFHTPQAKEGSKFYIKRLIGLPGDEVQLINGVLYINDQPAQSIYIAQHQSQDAYGNHYLTDEYEETLPNGVSYRIYYDHDMVAAVFPNTTQKYVIPDDHYFFLGDNRNHSVDSRFLGRIGFIPANNIIGKPRFIFWHQHGPMLTLWQNLKDNRHRLLRSLYSLSSDSVEQPTILNHSAL